MASAHRRPRHGHTGNNGRRTSVHPRTIVRLMAGYTKLFNSILMSSVWEEDTETRIVWVTLLALADQYGHVDGTIRSLARMARVSQVACQKALATFESPDEHDRSGVDQGRRIRPEQGGWIIVNHAAYRARISQDDRRERDKIRKRLRRLSAARPQTSEFVRDVSQAEAEAEAEAEAVEVPRARQQPLVSRRRLDAAFEYGRLYVPQRAHTDLSALHGNDGELFTFYEEICEDWTNGAHARTQPGADMIRFWKAQYDLRWPPAAGAKPSRLPAWAQEGS